MGIKDNEKADKQAKSTILDEIITDHVVQASSTKNIIKQIIE